MIRTDRRVTFFTFFTAAAIALLLFMSALDRTATVVLAAVLFAVGLVVFPEQRRTGLIAGGIALATALVLVLAVR